MSIGDLIFAFTDWLRNTPLLDLAAWISAGPVCAWLQSHFFAIPLFQTIHLLGIAVLFGSALMINLRVLGLNWTGRPIDEMIAAFQPWIWRGLAAVVLSGVFMVLAEPIRNLINGFFWTKMIALAVTVVLSLWFQSSLRRKSGTIAGDVLVMQSVSIRTTAVLITLLWCLVMAGGRYIAYAPV